ncbi:GAF domain-containing protein [Aggregatilinea lenta]|uniref:GAF domain-containing protein n=1 Tax=Aggregatilinea lenta TaxID=913108 RepID=UPI000E5A7567|nr:GAF domain-containing protein [Aggregatilinea lenta]
MASASIVRRLIAFLKKPDAAEGEDRAAVPQAGDAFEAQEAQQTWAGEPVTEATAPYAYSPPVPAPSSGGQSRIASYGSRLDALVMRAIQQFHAEHAYVIRHEDDGRMRYCTGRDMQGHYVPHTLVAADRRAVSLAVKSGESQLFVRTLDDNTPLSILCGPLWSDDEVIGVLYLNNPARSRLYRGVFDVFCDQAARMLVEGVA